MRRDLPSGTVTFLFTDVEGSTRLLHELGSEGYAEALAEHRRLIRAACARFGGVEVDTQGDAFFVAFPTAPGAIAAASEAQAKLAVPVRMGIHTGTPLASEEGYVGSDVHKAARIAAAGYGGQVVVSEQTARLTGGDELRELGEHRLKDLTAPERLYQLGGGDFPPLRTLHATNLPVAGSPLIGREAELAELVSLLSDATRVVTVTGPGGTGKTRFALQGAAELVDRFADGVYWVPLQAIADARLVLPTVAQTVGARIDLVGFLGGRRTLLLLDNLEHLLTAAPALADLVSRCPELRLLVTSRAPLRIAGEYEFPLDPLPDREASTLFVERARAAGRRIDPDETVAEICRRLDNLPLALELAAARTRLLTAPALLGRLERSLPVLTGGRRDAPERQRTLRATIEWSYDLLDEEAKRLFARLSVFAGSLSLESAEEVCDADLEALAVLVELSLLKPVGEDRFFMLETIGEYARERLDESSEAADVHARHADHFLHLIPPPVAGPLRLEPLSKESLDRLEEEYDNVRAAFDWLREIGDGERAIPAANSVFWTFLNVRGRAQEARPLLEAVLSIPGESDPEFRSAALVTLAILRGDMEDLQAARHLASEALELARSLDDSSHVQRALRTLARYQTDANEKRRLLLECEALAHDTEDENALTHVEMLLGYGAIEDGDYEEARRRLEQWLALAERGGRRSVVLLALIDLGCLAALDERFDDAREILVRALHGSSELGATGFATTCFDGLAAVAVDEGDAERATRLLAFAARFREENGEITQRHQRRLLERTEAAARRWLGPRFDAAWDAGRALTLDEAAKLALE